ncbi:MAG: hypothetical protein E4H03_08765 [Myxococcales bacterium]|nr:MAG: hypothetical protein E4H03_08765 [Myxococcales bacterium]
MKPPHTPIARPSPIALVAIGIALTALIWICYGGALGNDFVFDDAIFMERDIRVHSLNGAKRLFSEPLWGFVDAPDRRGTHQYYRPLQQLPLVVSSVWFDGSPRPAHLLSLALHATNVLLVLLLLTRLGANLQAAAVLAALFACHPAASESVLWIADAAGLGAVLCTLLCVLLRAGTRTEKGGGRWSWIATPAIGACTLLGAWFKESGALIPAFMIAYDVLARRARPPRIAHYAAAVTALALYFRLRIDALGALLPGAGQLELGVGELVVNAVALLPSYLKTLVWPFDLNMYHDFERASGLTDPRFLAGLLIMGAAVVAAALVRRRRPTAAFGLAWMALGAAPYLLVRWPQLNVFAERYLYMPMIGAAILCAALVGRVPRTAGAVAAIVIAVFVQTDRERTREWSNEVTIYTKTLTQSPRAELVRNNLALRYLALERPQAGLPIQRELLRLDPDFPSGWHNLGLLLIAAGDNAEAVVAFEKSRAHEPRNAATLLNLGYAYDLIGRREDAVAAYFSTVAAAPQDSRPWYNLALIALERGQLANADRAVQRVLALDADDHEAATLGRRVAAARAAVSSSETTPGTSSTQTERRCAAGREAAEEGRYAEAAAILSAAAWLDERSALPHHYLANVYYLQGRHTDALVHQRAALKRAPGNTVYARNLASLEALVSSPGSDEAE